MADHPAGPVPLCVDLDGTLVRSDMLHEATLLLARQSPLTLAQVPRWLAGGKARLKHLVAERVTIDAATLPYRAEIIDLIREARAAGQPVILATAAPRRVADAIAAHLGLFDEVMASDETLNLSARRKADALVARFGRGGFDYVGNHRDDLPVIAVARRSWLVGGGSLRRKAAAISPGTTFVEPGRAGLRVWARALRVYQWLKNLLVFVPLLASHQAGNPALLLAAIGAFFAFSFCASAIYVINDLMDLPADRLHVRKRRRPFASGALSASAGIIAAALLLIIAFGIAALLPPKFLIALAVYLGLTTAYSFALKGQVVVDVMILAGLYTMRILTGAAATNIPPSFWLLAFSMFAFLSLALVKRYSEMRLATSMLPGRGYRPEDAPVIMALGTASGMVSVLVLALYTQAEIVPALYPAREWLWALPPVMLYWTARLWMKAQRGEVHDDPVVFAATDWQSLAALAVMGGAVLLALTGWQPW